MTRILCIESSTEVCSVSLSENGLVSDFIEDSEGQNHARLLTLFIEQLLTRNKLKSSQLDAVAVSMGPGSYTGLRIGVSAAKGICYAAGLPLMAICPLRSMVWGVLNDPHKYQLQFEPSDLLIPMIDARRMEVYTSVFNNWLEPLTNVEALVIDNNSFRPELENHRCLFFGNGAAKCREVLTHPNAVFIEGVTTSSSHMAAIAFENFKRNDFVDVAYFEPFYLKDFKTTTPKNSILTNGD